MLAVFFLAVPAQPVHAGTDWKDAVAVIAGIRDEAITGLLDRLAEYQDFLTGDPSAVEAEAELAALVTDMEEVATEANDEIRSIMNEFPRAPQVQDSGAFAMGLVGLAEMYAIDRATLDYTEYVEGLPDVIPPVTTTTIPVTTTTIPVTTTTIPVTTTTIPVTTTTLPASDGPTTTTTTTTTTAIPPTTTTTVAPGVAGSRDTPVEPPASPADAEAAGSSLEGQAPAQNPGDGRVPNEGLGAIGDSSSFEVPGFSLSVLPDQRGLSASLSRVLEPVLPTAVTEVVVSPLLILELLWRAISSSGRGLVAPISLLTFSLISLLWDRRPKKLPIPA
jgi:hypothetical protein